MSIWELSRAEWTAASAAYVTTVVLLAWWMPWAYPQPYASFHPADEWDRKIVELERDRVLAVAKGLASSATGFLAALATALLKDELRTNLPVLPLIGCVAGAVGMILLAGSVNARTSIYVRDPTS